MTKLWARLTCGGCGRGFTADPERVPVFKVNDRGEHPMCLSCWDMRNRMRKALNLDPDDRPKAYPEDYSA